MNDAIHINYVKNHVRWVYRHLTHFASEEIKVQIHILSNSPKVTQLQSISHVKGVFTLENSFNHPSQHTHTHTPSVSVTSKSISSNYFKGTKKQQQQKKELKGKQKKE